MKNCSFCINPQVDSESNKIIGAEALIRWNHPELGIISPYEVYSDCRRNTTNYFNRKMDIRAGLQANETLARTRIFTFKNRCKFIC